jgi:mannose/fructose-specific phosphotransferase system component IIA
MVARNKSNYYVLSGVNLPMVLSFLTKKDNLGIRELTDIMEKDGHRGIFLE